MSASGVIARRLTVTGRVQGVGFRPFVYRLAHRLEVNGWIYNAAGVVMIAAEATADRLDLFETELIDTAPPLARPELKQKEPMSLESLDEFSIRQSEKEGRSDIHVPPDQFACDDCLAEMSDPSENRYQYPFINCTQCGPRYTIIHSMPYDRPNTAMAGFPLCAKCKAEYGDALDRRFHAQPLACPECGPELRYAGGDKCVTGNEAALASCLVDLNHGDIVAVKGIGGYHLLCDAGKEETVSRLRQRKHRPSKPLAIMVPWVGKDGLDLVRNLANPSDLQLKALVNPQRPIVLVPIRSHTSIAAAVAPGLDEIGLMLPYSPLHHLLLDAFHRPLVATSANISGEPVMTDPVEVESRLAHIADSFLHHNRPIQRPADDPVIREVAGVARPIRLGRGNAPLELDLPFTLARPILAVGAFLKNTVALAWEDRAVISPHIGDLGCRRSRLVFQQTLDDLQSLYAVKAQCVVSDVHPDYPNTRWARDCGLPMTSIYHHHAHASALAGELGIDRRMLVFTWDGLGLGEDHTAWGGEALLGQIGDWRRVASFRPFRLPGGDRVVYEPWRTALSLTWESELHWPKAPAAPALLKKAWERGLNSPLSSSVGRLFDAAAVFSGLLTEVSYDGEAPILFEAACISKTDAINACIDLPLSVDNDGIWRADWSPLVSYLISTEAPTGELASVFHESMARSLVKQARLLCDTYNVIDVGLTGGVFQNRRLADTVVRQLTESGFKVQMPRLLPVNDGAISFGQIMEAGVSMGGKYVQAR